MSEKLKESTNGSNGSSERASSPDNHVNKDGLLSKLKGMLWPDWAQRGARSPRAWKIFIRSMIAVFGTVVLMVDTRSLNFMGQAGFFGLILAMMLPPYLAFSIFFFALLTVIVGMCLGWAWGVAAMAAGLQARDQALLAQQTQSLRASLNPQGNISLQQQTAVFHGHFLDPRSSTVVGVMFFLGAYVFGWIRATRPKLMIMSIFGTIIMDLMCSYAPLFPSQQYTLARTLLIPAGLYIAIAFAATILIFPQSLNHIFITELIDTNLKPIKSLVQLQDEIAKTSPMDEARVSQLAAKAKGLRASHVQGVNGLEGKVGMLQLEVTRGQIGAGDLTRVFQKAKEIGARSYALGAFVMIQDEAHKTLSKVSNENTSGNNLRIRKHADAVKKHRHPGTLFDDLMPIIASSSADLRLAANKGLDNAIEWLDVVNHSRWTKPKATAKDVSIREENLAELKKALTEFRSSKQFQVLDQYRDLFDESGNIRPGTEHIVRASTPTLFRCNVFVSSLIGFSIKLQEFLELLLEIEHANPKARIQLPSAFAKMLVKTANSTSGDPNPLDMGTQNEEYEESDAASSTDTLVEGKKEKSAKIKTYPRDPDARDPSNVFQRFGRVVSKLGKALTSPEGLFALKYGIVSVALWTPQVIRSSAWFTYHNRGLWALIMAQTGLGVFPGEQIASFVTRIIGTVVGLVIGMVVWYIGAPGTNSGNPYGIAAATMVFIAPLLFMRILAPIQSMAFWLMAAVTTVFVVGYSWVDEHVAQLANQGSGAGLAGRRALLVIIGFTAAFIVMFFPRPLSARQIVRQTIAKNIGATSDLYSDILGGVEADAQVEDPNAKLDSAARIEKIRKPFMKILVRMQRIRMQMAFASAEPGMRGPWPKKQYNALVDSLGNMLSALALLSTSYANLHPTWCRRLEKSDHLNPAFIADCLALFALLQQSLSTGQPLPPTMPIFERLAYHSIQRGHMIRSKKASKAGEALSKEDIDTKDDTQNSDIGPLEAENDARALQLLEEPLTWDICHDEQLSIFSTAVVALTHVFNGLNEMQRIIIELVGVKEHGQFEKAQERWGRSEVA